MIQISTPATSANLGPGFDILGLALNLYNEYEVDLSDTLIFKNVEEKFANKDNLFYKSYKKTCNLYGINNEIYINFKSINIPISRGLGSSSAMIVGGILACKYLNNLNIDNDTMLEIATEIEGHPDNVSPCINGGLTISKMIKNEDTDFIWYHKINLNSNIHFTVIIPPYETNTEEARKILPNDISLKQGIENVSNALLLIEALKNNKLDNLNIFINDNFHVPYRKKLIKDYDNFKNICYKNGAKGFTISGSGSTMIAITNDNNFSKKISINADYKILDLEVDNNGARVI